MNIEQLKIIQTVVKHGSINEAAKKLHKTQPALSMAIKRLESEIGFSLFNRDGYRLALNDKGQIFYQKSQHILAELEQLESLSDAINRGEEHELTVNIEGPAMHPMVFSAFKSIQRMYPHTQLNIQTVKLLHGLKNLIAGNVDLTITPWIDAFNLEGDFQTKAITSLDFEFCIHKSLAAEYDLNAPSDINANRLKAIPQLSPTELAFNLSNTPLLKKISHNIVKVDDIHCYMQSLRGQLGWGPILKSLLPSDSIDEFWFFELGPKDEQFTIDVRVAKTKNKVLGPVAQALWQAL